MAILLSIKSLNSKCYNGKNSNFQKIKKTMSQPLIYKKANPVSPKMLYKCKKTIDNKQIINLCNYCSLQINGFSIVFTSIIFYQSKHIKPVKSISLVILEQFFFETILKLFQSKILLIHLEIHLNGLSHKFKLFPSAIREKLMRKDFVNCSS